jgi:hypothetical protein
MKFGFLMLTAILMAAFPSCGPCSTKTYDCPGFTDTSGIYRWFPYSNNQQLLFVSGTGEKDSFRLKNTETTPPGRITSSSSTNPCQALKVFRSLEMNAQGQPLFQLTMNTFPQNRSFSTAFLRIKNTLVDLSNLADTGFTNIMINGRVTSIRTFPALTLNGTTFNQVIAATRDTAGDVGNSIYRFYYSRNAGVIGYSEYPSLKTWAKQ